MITCINYNRRYNIILTSDDKGLLFIRKYYNFELLTKIQINNNLGISFINKIFLNDYDIICTVNYNRQNFKSFLSFYSINGILLEQSESCLKKDNLFIFGFNGIKNKDNKRGNTIEDNGLSNLDKNIMNIASFIIEDNIIYILTKSGRFIKTYYNKLDQLSYGVDILD